MYFLTAACENVAILRIIYFVKLLLNIVFVAIPIILIVMMIMDFVKSLTASDEKDQTKTMKLTIKRVVSAILIFFVPLIVSLVMGLLEDAGAKGYVLCYTNATSEKINELAANTQTEIKMLMKADYSKVYFTSDNVSSCPNYFNYSVNVNENSGGCYTELIKSSEKGVYWYQAPSENYCIRNWTYTNDVSNIIEDTNNTSSGCILKRNISVGNGIQYVGSSETTNVPMKDASKNILIGDSRMVGIEGLNIDANDIFIAKTSMGYTWLENTALPELRNAVNNSDKTFNIIINLGVNDLGNKEKYIEIYKKIAEEFSSHNIIIVSVNPIYEPLYKQFYSYDITNDKITDFNKEIKNNLESNVKYCDTYNKFIGNMENVTGDGVHYMPDYSQKVYEYMIECTK